MGSSHLSFFSRRAFLLRELRRNLCPMPLSGPCSVLIFDRPLSLAPSVAFCSGLGLVSFLKKIGGNSYPRRTEFLQSPQSVERAYCFGRCPSQKSKRCFSFDHCCGGRECFGPAIARVDPDCGRLFGQRVSHGGIPRAVRWLFLCSPKLSLGSGESFCRALERMHLMVRGQVAYYFPAGIQHFLPGALIWSNPGNGLSKRFAPSQPNPFIGSLKWAPDARNSAWNYGMVIAYLHDSPLSTSLSCRLQLCSQEVLSLD